MFDILRRADEVMREHGFLPEFSQETMEAAARQIERNGEAVKDLRDLFWVSIDNMSTRNFDQVQFAREIGNGALQVLVGIADVERRVPKDSPIDRHACTNTTSIYAGVKTYHMLPKELSAENTSLLPNEDRWVVVAEVEVNGEGKARSTAVYPALIRNKAAFNYDNVSGWFERGKPLQAPEDVAKEAAAQLELQRRAFACLQVFRRNQGALTFSRCEPTALVEKGELKCVWDETTNCAREMIEAFMVEANIAVADHLKEKGFPSIQRIVRRPKRWDRIQQIARDYGSRMPAEPDVNALAEFMVKERSKDPGGFRRLSSSIMKLIGAGEYHVEGPGLQDEPHFSLAVNDYAHSTAPNRRFADLVTQRLIKSREKIYTSDELIEIALHCTERARAARRVERIIRKSAAAVLLMKRIGSTFDAWVTGVKANATYARLEDFPAEGRVVIGEQGLDVGDRIRVKLLSVNPERGFIDFENVKVTQKL